MSPTTIAEALARTAGAFAAAGIEDGRLEVEVLFAHALGVNRTHLLAELQSTLDPTARHQIEALALRRLRHEPLAYIVGAREFFGLTIRCTPAALIPRPETELLAEIALEECARRAGPVHIADVGTGSGAIAIAVAASVPNASLTAIDSSRDALYLARDNARAAGVEQRIEFVQSDLLGGTAAFDVILANLPYVAEDDWSQLAPEVRDWEPRAALVGGRSGTEVIERLLADARVRLRPGGVVVAEIGAEQGGRLRACARGHFPTAALEVRTDLAGLDRALVVRLGDE